MSLEKAQQGLLLTSKNLFAGWTTPMAVCWENTTFAAPDSSPWLAVFFVPVDNSVNTLGPTGLDEEIGFLQIDVNYPKGGGESDMRATLEKIRRCFYNGRRITFDGQMVTILSASSSGGRIVDNHYRKSITVRWRTYIQRPPP